MRSSDEEETKSSRKRLLSANNVDKFAESESDDGECQSSMNRLLSANNVENFTGRRLDILYVVYGTMTMNPSSLEVEIMTSLWGNMLEKKFGFCRLTSS